MHMCYREKAYSRSFKVISFDTLVVISRMHSSASISCECPKGLFSRSPYRLIGSPWRCPAVPYGSSHRSPTSRLDKDCGLLHPTIYSFLLSLSDCLLLDVMPSFSLSPHMERPTGRCHLSHSLSTISSHLQKTTKTASVSTVISNIFYLVYLVISWPSIIN